jgi:hypothetical protein
MRRRHLASVSVAGAILIGLATGCTATHQDTLTANMLNVQMAISDPQVTAPGASASLVGIKVTVFADLSYSQERVSISDTDSFSCDGAPLVRDGSLQYSFLGSIPSARVPANQTCTYTHDGKATQFSFATPQRPDVLAPVTNARVSPAQDLTVQFTPSLTAPTVIGIDGKPVMTLAQQIGEAIIPSEVVHQFLTSAKFTLTVSQTSLLTPTSDFNDLEIEYTSSTVIPLTMSW